MKKYGVEKIFEEQVSGKNIKDRPQLQLLLDYARDENDTIYVESFSRLARNTKHLLSIVELLNTKKVKLVSDKEQIDTTTASGRLFLTIISGLVSFERECLLERQREGIEIAKTKGVYKGRKPIEVIDFGPHYRAYMQRECTKGELARSLGISRPTLNKLFSEYEQRLAGAAE